MGWARLHPAPRGPSTSTLRPTAAGRLTLTGTVSAAEPDTVPPNDTDRAAVTVGLATVALTATADPPVLRPGGATTIDIKAVTRGRRPARNARVCVRVPQRPDHQEAGRRDAARRTAVLAHRPARPGSPPHAPAPRRGPGRDARPHGRPRGHRAGCRRAHAPRARRAPHPPCRRAPAGASRAKAADTRPGPKRRCLLWKRDHLPALGDPAAALSSARIAYRRVGTGNRSFQALQ